ncbi:hypothetical protein MMC22_012059 [Lobaria immixta]|nr:hypothetical protein [Lobaria immixta]
MECTCYGYELVCGFSRWVSVTALIRYCFNHCNCGDDTKINRQEPTKRLEYRPPLFAAPQKVGSDGSTGSRAPNPHRAPSGNHLTGSTPSSTHTCDIRNGQQRSCCSKKCTAVNRDCDWFFTGDCKCYAPPVGLFFWFSGLCGSVHHLPKRDLAQQRHSYLLNATARYAPPNNAIAPPGPSPELHVQLASGLLPSPCNASYVSFGCADSTDGIVHEPPQNWLGALLPEDVTDFPPVPEDFLRIHKL